jgi:hypothetical protein
LDLECGRYWFYSDFIVISAAENSNKFQKTSFWKDKSIDNVVALEGSRFQFKHDFPFIFGCSKNKYIHCKTMFTYWISYFVMGSHLGQQPMPH